MVGTNTMFFNNRINFEPILKDLLEMTPKNEDGQYNMEISIQYQLPYSLSREGLNLYID